METRINYTGILKRHPWITEKNQKVILSPDSDGLLCGLFMSNFLDWEIVGFYDGKVLVLNKGLSAKDCIFLDMEIFRKDIRSVGHHMVLYDINDLPRNWSNFENSIQPNNIRGYDYHHVFNLKYPLATIHLLIGILGNKIKFNIPESAICPLVYTDGTFKNLFNYPENCLSWLNFLGAESKDTPLYSIFFNDHYSIIELMKALMDFFKRLGQINDGKRGGDKIKISDSKSKLQSFKLNKGSYSLSGDEKKKAEELLKLLSELTTWEYNPRLWDWDNKKIFYFSKSNIKPGKRNYFELINKNPLSFAITSGLAIEYTLERPNSLP